MRGTLAQHQCHTSYTNPVQYNTVNGSLHPMALTHEPTKQQQTTTTTTVLRPFVRDSRGVSRYHYQKKHSPTTHHHDHHPIFISFFHLLRSIASSLFKLRAWQLKKTFQHQRTIIDDDDDDKI